MTHYEEVKQRMRGNSRTWLVTGTAGFIGSNLLEALLLLDQNVVGLDNLSTGKRSNLEEVRKLVGAERWSRFRFYEGDVCDMATCRNACNGVDFVLHQAALGSVPRSIEDPLRSHASNVDGFLNLLTAARDARVERFVYASSSSVYGDHPGLPKVEHVTGSVLSPYAATKLVDEIYAKVWARCYGLATVGLRYFNVFGPRQDPSGAYAAVIPKWFSATIAGSEILINGDGSTSRDFCYIANVVQANILVAQASLENPSEVYNVACGARTTLRELQSMIEVLAAPKKAVTVIYRDERAGDVKHSLADISKARRDFGYDPLISISDGLRLASEWYTRRADGTSS